MSAGLRQADPTTSSREGCGRLIAARIRRDPTTEISPDRGSGSAVVPAMTMIAFPAAGLPLSAPQIFRNPERRSRLSGVPGLTELEAPACRPGPAVPPVVSARLRGILRGELPGGPSIPAGMSASREMPGRRASSKFQRPPRPRRLLVSR